MPEMDRVLGGGLVRGSTALIGGDPGIGKSTLILQVSDRLAQMVKVLYVSAEESQTQIKLRAERLGISSPNLYILCETDIEIIQHHMDKIRPGLTVIDSIQMTYKPLIPSAPGTVTQVRECAAELAYMGKRLEISLFIIGHVTKEGAIAGPKTLEHMVDAVFYFEGDRFQNYRVLRAVKNRFGSTNELGLFEMGAKGLREVTNPSEIFLSSDRRSRPGSATVPSIVGSRTLLVEIQALTTRTGIGIPARRVSGVDFNRVAMILAVLERRGRLPLGMQDIFVNAVGGVRIEEPAADLAIAMAIASSFQARPLDPKVLLVGEVGLGGEIRGITQIQTRVQEAQRLGFSKLFLPEENIKGLAIPKGIDVEGVSHIREAMELLKII
jgi:DNA repair protein RadA/Sms